MIAPIDIDKPFNVGDVVELKSGGPAMVIAKIEKDTYNSNYYTECVWADDSKNIHQRSFVSAVLRKILNG